MVKRVFTVLDWKEGFYQVELQDEAADLCTFNTVFGCYKFLRLPFGLKNAPQIFQKLNFKNFGDIAGISLDEERIDSIKNLKVPKNATELQSILGMVHFLRNFPQISLRELLKKNKKFCWLPTHTEILNKVNDKITNSPVLGIFDTKKKITIQTNASQNGLGSCIMQERKPIAYASQSLTDCKKRYAQI